MDESLLDYSVPVYKALSEKNELLGIGIYPALFILVFTIILINLFNIWCSVIGLVLFLIARKVCKKDSLMLTILFERLLEPDVWRC